MTNFTQYPGSIDRSTSAFYFNFSATVGDGGVIAGYPVKYDTSGNVVLCASQHDNVIGLARDTISSGSQVAVLGQNATVQTPFTLSTIGSKVGVDGSGNLVAWASSGTVVGICVSTATSASLVQVQISLETV